MSTTVNIVDYGSIDFALRVIESIAFISLSIVAITEPCTGYIRGIFNESNESVGDIPIWFWPICGILLAMVAIANFSSNNTIVLVIQFFIIVSHRRFEPGVFVIIACGVASIRMDSLLLTLSGTCGIILVKKLLSSSATAAAALRSGIISILIIVRKLSSLAAVPAVPAVPAASREIDYGDRV